MAKYALTIGINEYGHGSDLAGCVADANDWAATLADRGHDVRQLLDGAATKRAITTAINEMLAKSRRGDSVVVTYSGHGSWQPDQNGDEADGRDEGLCPVDLWDVGLLLDDELHDLFLARPYGARVAMISDSCHSGTVSRFAPPLRPRVYRDSEHSFMTDIPSRRPRYLPPATFLTGERLARATDRTVPILNKPRHPYLLVAGCADWEYSYDAYFGNRPNGAFTRAALDALQSGPTTYAAWFRAIRQRLPSIDFPDQTPQLYGTYAQKSWPVLA